MKKAFTLIELLVVITIIGILAVGGIQIYTSQIQKARDSTRVRNIQALNNGFIQYELDNSKVYEIFPRGAGMLVASNNMRTAMKTYVPNIDNIHEGKNHKKLNCLSEDGNTKIECVYIYREADPAINGYKLSVAFESKSNVCLNTEKCFGTDDGGILGNSYEVGTNLSLIAHPSSFRLDITPEDYLP